MWNETNTLNYLNLQILQIESFLYGSEHSLKVTDVFLLIFSSSRPQKPFNLLAQHSAYLQSCHLYIKV